MLATKSDGKIGFYTFFSVQMFLAYIWNFWKFFKGSKSALNSWYPPVAKFEVKIAPLAQ